MSLSNQQILTIAIAVIATIGVIIAILMKKKSTEYFVGPPTATIDSFDRLIMYQGQNTSQFQIEFLKDGRQVFGPISIRAERINIFPLSGFYFLPKGEYTLKITGIQITRRPPPMGNQISPSAPYYINWTNWDPAVKKAAEAAAAKKAAEAAAQAAAAAKAEADRLAAIEWETSKFNRNRDKGSGK